MFTFFLIIALVLINIFGKANEVVHNFNDAFGTHMSGLGVWIVAFFTCLFLDAILSKK
jgi:hypothetical protein